MAAKLFSSQGFRTWLQVLGLIAGAAFMILIILGYPYAVHALCPYATICFGISKSVLLGLTSVMFGITVAIGIGILIHSIFYGRKFCGYLCPLGTWQEAIFSFRSRKYRSRHRIPYIYEKRFARLKYWLLLLTSLLSLGGVAYIYIRLCPLFALSLLPRLAIPGLVVFLLISIVAAFTERLWCRWLCPYAALMNIFQYLGAWFGIKRRKIHRNLERCVDCGICMIYCPMNLNIAEDEYVQSPECVHCLVCASKCPKPGTFCCEKENE